MSDTRITAGEKARDFSLDNTSGEKVALSDFEGKQNIYLVFNRGFT
jgi:peroxiredoxin